MALRVDFVDTRRSGVARSFPQDVATGAQTGLELGEAGGQSTGSKKTNCRERRSDTVEAKNYQNEVRKGSAARINGSHLEWEVADSRLENFVCSGHQVWPLTFLETSARPAVGRAAIRLQARGPAVCSASLLSHSNRFCPNSGAASDTPAPHGGAILKIMRTRHNFP